LSSLEDRGVYRNELAISGRKLIEELGPRDNRLLGKALDRRRN
jgi:hypothetical protein